VLLQLCLALTSVLPWRYVFAFAPCLSPLLLSCQGRVSRPLHHGMGRSGGGVCDWRAFG
jgi:hypothetical protein